MTTVYMGAAGEAAAVCAMLQSRGIPAFIPDDWIRTLAPFDTGGLLLFDRAVQVPDAAADAARAMLEERDEGSEPRPDEQELPPGFFEEEGEQVLPPGFFEEGKEGSEALRLTAAASGRRIRWAAVTPFGLFFVPFQIGPYLRAVAQLGTPPPHHRATIVAAFLSPVFGLIWIGPMILYWLPIRVDWFG
jgi:hypothetical protein